MKRYVRVNFDPNHVELFKEVRYLDWLLPAMLRTNSIPASLRSVAKEAYLRYPVAVAVQAALASFANAKVKLLVIFIWNFPCLKSFTIDFHM